jgi:hypothetical protein
MDKKKNKNIYLRETKFLILLFTCWNYIYDLLDYDYLCSKVTQYQAYHFCYNNNRNVIFIIII